MSYKLLALDMDGTLLNRDNTISPENHFWIRKAKQAGVHIVLSTGRPLREVQNYAAELKLTGPLIVNNGSEVWKAPGLLHSRHLLKNVQIVKIMDRIGSEREHIQFWAHSLTSTIVSAEQFTRLPLQDEWLQIGIKSDKAEWLMEAGDDFRSWEMIEVSQSHPDNIELNAKGRSKGAGLLEICNLLNISPEETIAVGDGCNDISAFREAGLGIAMGNAPEAVKRAADFVTAANHQDGVAQAIKDFVLTS